jgi:endo-1,4-beta-D-glucanase Y
VIRRDQGGDAVSEGQAYAMLLAVAVGDTNAFGRAWGWARAHLQRSDGLLSWHWVNGSVVDSQSAGDADLIAAWALDLASQRFHTTAYHDAASTIARSLMSEETVAYGDARLLVAGPWARAQPAWVNPSYFTPGAFADLAKIDAGFNALEAGSTRALHALTARAPHLPPDWARQSGSSVRASSSPDGQSPRYGYDAVRVPLWMSVSCRSGDRAIAAAMWAFLNRSSIARVYTLDGKPLDRTPSTESLIAAAAAARAAGDARDVSRLLDKAKQLSDAQPRYYASALLALGRVLLQTDLLNSC